MNKLTLGLITFASTIALAQGAGSGAAKAPETKKDAPKAEPTKADAPKADAPKADAKAPEAKKAEMPKPPAEVAELGKTLAGTWNCTGQMADMTDPTKMNPMKMKMVMKLDADKAWIVAALSGGPFKMTIMTTYDTNSKKWYRVLTDNMGGSETSWSAGLQNNKVVWDGESRGLGMKPYKVRTTEDMVSPKEVKMTGEMSMDGKAWAKGWEATCKK